MFPDRLLEEGDLDFFSWGQNSWGTRKRPKEPTVTDEELRCAYEIVLKYHRRLNLRQYMELKEALTDPNFWTND